MTILNLNYLSQVKLAIQTLNNKREIVWENDKFKDIFGHDDRRGRKCWELMHPDNPACEKCETRGSYIRKISKGGLSKRYIINASRINGRGFVLFIEEIENISNLYETLNEEIGRVKEKLSALVNRLDTVVICSSCNRLRLRDGTWVDNRLESGEKLFIEDISHGYCPACAKKIIAEI